MNFVQQALQSEAQQEIGSEIQGFLGGSQQGQQQQGQQQQGQQQQGQQQQGQQPQGQQQQSSSSNPDTKYDSYIEKGLAYAETNILHQDASKFTSQNEKAADFLSNQIENYQNKR